MAEIRPFKAFIPKENCAKSISTRQINSYSEQELDEIISINKDSFLNIILHGRHKEMKTHERFEIIHNLFENSIEKGLFTESQQESIYLYKQSNSTFSYCGFIAGASAKEYQENKIKKHEHTLEKREKLFTKYLRLTGFNAEPILLIHPKKESLSQVITENTASTPIHSFNANDGFKHELWEITDKHTLKTIQKSFKELDCLYIADGHHRSASSSLLALEDTNKDSTQFVMALFMSEEDITIHDFNRVVKNSEKKTNSEIRQGLEIQFKLIEESDSILEPKTKHEFCIYLDKKWIRIKLNKSFNSESTVVEQLDPQIITDYILSPIFGIKDLKNDKRVDFVPGNKGLESLQKKVDEGEFDIAIAMFPVGVEEMKTIADEGLVMPPKSTFIEPKLRSGLTIYKF